MSFRLGLPQFDDQGFYTGPLQKRSASKQLIGQQQSKFNTTGSEQWPSSFCKWVAQQIIQTAHTSNPCGGGLEQSDVGAIYKISEEGKSKEEKENRDFAEFLARRKNFMMGLG